MKGILFITFLISAHDSNSQDIFTTHILYNNLFKSINIYIYKIYTKCYKDTKRFLTSEVMRAESKDWNWTFSCSDCNEWRLFTNCPKLIHMLKPVSTHPAKRARTICTWKRAEEGRRLFERTVLQAPSICQQNRCGFFNSTDACGPERQTTSYCRIPKSRISPLWAGHRYKGFPNPWTITRIFNLHQIRCKLFRCPFNKTSRWREGPASDRPSHPSSVWLAVSPWF